MSTVLVAKAGPVTTLTLNRAEKRNALDAATVALLLEAFRAPVAAEDRVIVLRANGPVFCAGLDMVERGKTRFTGAANHFEALLHTVETHPLPVVAVVQGDAIAGGNELALHCDLVVASQKARFGMSLAQIGLAPSWFLAKKLMEVAGPAVTREILLLGDPLPAAKLHAFGIIARCPPPEELEAAAQKVIDRLAANAPLSLRAMKALIVRQLAFRDGIAHDDVTKMVEAARTSEDAREGITARLEKRTARFTGR